MSQISRHRRFKRVALPTKKTQFFVRYSGNRGCMASYEKLKSNNSSLAKALSKQKEKRQMLFTQNVALLAEVQDLSSACIKRDNTIIKVEQNVREVLDMIVTMSKIVTNTIASCREFTASSNANVQLSLNSFSKGENRRLSNKSRTKGIVKPMVSGLTITKPTINLSRVNMQHFNNPSNLSTIEEVSIPVAISPPISNINVNSSPSSVSLNRQGRDANSRIYRMPERVNIISSRSSEGDERRISKRRSRHSGQSYERRSRSKSNGLMTSINRERTDLASPRVKLNDVSKLLQNCQTINIRRLASMKDNVSNENIKMNDPTNNISNKQNKNVIISERNNLEQSGNNNTIVENNRTQFESEQQLPVLNVERNSSDSRNLTLSNENDPLEGPSWLLDNYNNSLSLINTNSEVRDCNSKSNDTAKASTIDTTGCNSDSDTDNDEENNEELNNFNWKKTINKTSTSEKENVLNRIRGNDLQMEENINTNKEEFVTRQRGSSTETMDEDLDDFTLMYMRQNNMNNVSFTLNDLRLPVLEDSVIKSVNKKQQPESEITMTGLTNLTENNEIPLISNDICNDDSLVDHTTVKLPLLSNNTIDCTIPVVDISLDMHRQIKSPRISQSFEVVNHFESITSRKAKKRKQKRSINDKDPSAVKVVLQKLTDDFHVKLQPLSSEETLSQNSSLLSDSENSTGSVNLNDLTNDLSKRPRRQKAPQNLKEPNLIKKLRRFK